jgi:hypothetical protein
MGNGGYSSRYGGKRWIHEGLLYLVYLLNSWKRSGKSHCYLEANGNAGLSTFFSPNSGSHHDSSLEIIKNRFRAAYT